MLLLYDSTGNVLAFVPNRYVVLGKAVQVDIEPLDDCAIFRGMHDVDVKRHKHPSHHWEVQQYEGDVQTRRIQSGTGNQRPHEPRGAIGFRDAGTWRSVLEASRASAPVDVQGAIDRVLRMWI